MKWLFQKGPIEQSETFQIYLGKQKEVKMKNITIISVLLMALIMPVAPVFSEEARQIPEGINLKSGEAIFNSARFQSSVKGEKSLGALAVENSVVGKDSASFGFAEKSEEAKFFLIGSIYSEALAYLQDGDTELAAKRLDLIEKEFITLGVPASLFNYIDKTRNMIQANRYKKDALFDVLTLFQPFFEDYAKNKSEDKFILFRAGTWIMDMSLAAAAKDKNLLKQPGKINYFIKEMKRMDAPKGVLTALDEMEKIANKTDITDKDTKTVLELVKKIQTILG
jgi:hypothetical protein